MVTIISLCVIALFFVYFVFEAGKIYKVMKTIAEITRVDSDIVSGMENTRFKHIRDEYCKSLNVLTQEGTKTNIPAIEYFNEDNIFASYGINSKLLDTASGTLVGLGLFGTFLGLTLGISGFDSSSTDNIQASIQNLLGGMATAFATSLLGMVLSIAFTSLYKSWKNKCARQTLSLTEKLDATYYIDDVNLQKMNQTQLFDSIIINIRQLIKEEFQKSTEILDGRLSYMNENGDIINVSDAVREIMSENKEQTKVFKSFTTDLAIELNNTFDDTLAKQIEDKIVPHFETVEKASDNINKISIQIEKNHKEMVDCVDKVSVSVSSPATDMISQIVDELRSSMSSMMGEFQRSLSGNAVSQLENLAQKLSSATDTMAGFPSCMNDVTTTLQSTMDSVKFTIEEISSSFANANTDAIGQLQSATEHITSDIGQKQTQLLRMQDQTTENTKVLLELFNTAISRLEQSNKDIKNTMDGFSGAQGDINQTAITLNAVSKDIKDAILQMNNTQNVVMSKINEMIIKTVHSIDEATDLLEESSDLSKQYTEEFSVIKGGLEEVFIKLNKGLKDYSSVVEESTRTYLENYTTHLTSTTNALAGVIQQLNDAVEVLNDVVTNKR